MNPDQSVATRRAIHFRRRALLVYGAFALALIPWSMYLGSSLPSRHETQHWNFLWAGFDAGLFLAGAATAVAVLRNSHTLALCAAVTGTLLLCDVWFDLWTSRPGSERAWAIGEAAVAEVPLALFSFWVAHDAEKMGAAAQRYVAERRKRRADRLSVASPD